MQSLSAALAAVLATALAAKVLTPPCTVTEDASEDMVYQWYMIHKIEKMISILFLKFATNQNRFFVPCVFLRDFE